MEWYNKIESTRSPTQPFSRRSGSPTRAVKSKLEDALKYYKKAVELQPEFLDGIYQLGLTYLALGRNPDAIAAFESYLTHDADSGRATRSRASSIS